MIKTQNSEFDAVWNGYLETINAYLDEALSPSHGVDPSLLEVLRYSILGGGKRIRPVLALAACEAVGGNPADALAPGCALEMIHAYSLVHDDMPCMDDDAMRRGQPTVHKKWDEATAVLAGDGIQADALALVSDARRYSGAVSFERMLQVTREVAMAAGSVGMVGGQWLDISARERELDQKGVERLHAMKTGALIRGAAVCGGIVGGASPTEVANLHRYGVAVGALFQLTDDLLDATEEEMTEDEKAVNFFAILGEEALKAAIESEAQAAIEIAEGFGPKGVFLRQYASFIARRTV